MYRREESLGRIRPGLAVAIIGSTAVATEIILISPVVAQDEQDYSEYIECEEEGTIPSWVDDMNSDGQPGPNVHEFICILPPGCSRVPEEPGNWNSFSNQEIRDFRASQVVVCPEPAETPPTTISEGDDITGQESIDSTVITDEPVEVVESVTEDMTTPESIPEPDEKPPTTISEGDDITGQESIDSTVITDEPVEVVESVTEDMTTPESIPEPDEKPPTTISEADDITGQESITLQPSDMPHSETDSLPEIIGLTIIVAFLVGALALAVRRRRLNRVASSNLD